MSTHDRTIHGATEAGDEIVRYDRAGKWYIESPGTRSGRTNVSVKVAAELAARGVHYPGWMGGRTLDALVRKQKENN